MSPGDRLGHHFASRDPDHIARWVDAQRAGVARAKRCGAIGATTGRPCRYLPLRGCARCYHHQGGVERDAADLAALPRIRFIATTKRGVRQAKAARRLGNIERRLLRRTWKHTPESPGSTLALDPSSERRVRRYLRRAHGLDLDAYEPETRRPLTPRSIDNLRWIAMMSLSGRITEERARERVAGTLKAELSYWAKADAIAAQDALA